MDSTTSAAAIQADQLLGELTKLPVPAAREQAPTMGKLKKVAYTHEALIDLMIEGASRPGGITQKEIAGHFGYTEGWISNILASDAFQARLAARRQEILDPVLNATLKERFEALARRSLDVLMEKLNAGAVSEQVAMRAAELGAKVYMHREEVEANRQGSDTTDRLTRLAERLVGLQSQARQGVTINAQTGEIEQLPAPSQGA